MAQALLARFHSLRYGVDAMKVERGTRQEDFDGQATGGTA